MRVTKGFTFESAHRLSGYEGKCKRIHGHNYRGVVTVEGVVDDRGILVDFSDLKKLIKEKIVTAFDHKLILKQGSSKNSEIATVLDDDWITWVDYNPTAENMATHFLHMLQEAMPSVLTVEVFETDDSSAIATE